MVEIKLQKAHSGQAMFGRKIRRNNTVPCARRFGKSNTIHAVLAKMKETGNYVFPLIWPCLPGFSENPGDMGIFSHEQKDFAPVFDEIIELYEPIIEHKDATAKNVKFRNGGMLEFWSLANVGKQDSGRGRKYIRVIYDECQKISDPVFRHHHQNVVTPLLADLKGDCFFLGTPNGKRTYFYELCERGAGNGCGDFDGEHKGDKWPDWATIALKTKDNPLIDPVEIENMRKVLDELTYMQEIEGRFVDYSANAWCYALKPPEVQKRILKGGLKIWPNVPLIFSFDFNKNPMTAIVGQVTPAPLVLEAGMASAWQPGFRVQVLDNFVSAEKTENSIYDTCEKIRAWVLHRTGQRIGRWRDHLGNIIANYPCALPILITGDASGGYGDGRQKIPETYYQIICIELGLSTAAVQVPSKNPFLSESYIQINTHIQHNQYFEISNGCDELIRDMLQVKSDAFRGIDKADASLSHLLDCLRYLFNSFVQTN